MGKMLAELEYDIQPSMGEGTLVNPVAAVDIGVGAYVYVATASIAVSQIWSHMLQ